MFVWKRGFWLITCINRNLYYMNEVCVCVWHFPVVILTNGVHIYEQVDDHMISGDHLSRINNENKKLKEMLKIVWENYNSLQTHVKKLMQEKQVPESNPKKRKLDETVQQSLWKRQNWNLESPRNTGVQRVYIPTDPSDKSLVLD